MKELTKRQSEILFYIQSYTERNGFPPSIREIGKDFNIGSLRGVTVHLDALERKGIISRASTPRSIKVLKGRDFREETMFVLEQLLISTNPGLVIFEMGMRILGKDRYERNVYPYLSVNKRWPVEWDTPAPLEVA